MSKIKDFWLLIYQFHAKEGRRKKREKKICIFVQDHELTCCVFPQFIYVHIYQHARRLERVFIQAEKKLGKHSLVKENADNDNDADCSMLIIKDYLNNILNY